MKNNTTHIDVPGSTAECDVSGVSGRVHTDVRR